MITVYNAQGEPVCGLTASDIDQFFISHAEEKEDSLCFQIHPDHPNFQYLDEETRLLYGNNYFLIKGINRGGTVTVTSSVDLDFLKGRIYHPYESETQTLAAVLSGCLPAGWTILGAEKNAIKRTIRFDAATDYDVLSEAKKTYAVQYSWNTRDKILTVLDPEEENFLGEYLTEELNLKRLDYKGDTASFATRLYCYGKDGLTISSVNGGREYVENHAYSDKVVCAYWIDERYTVAENLKKDAQERLDAMACPARSYECDVVDLARLDPDYDFLEFSLGKSVALLDQRRGTRMLHKIVQYTEYPFDPIKNKVVLSNTAAQIQDVIHKIEDKVEDLDKKTGQFIKELIDTDREFMRRFTEVDKSMSEIRQTAEEISLRVTDEVNRLSASIQVNADAIKTKVSRGQVSTIIEQSADSVAIAFNGISSIIQIESDGFHFYSSGNYLGKMGTDSSGGLVFDMSRSNKAHMAWLRDGAERMIWYPFDQGSGAQQGLHTDNLYPDYVDMQDGPINNCGKISMKDDIKMNGYDILNPGNIETK